MCPGKTSLPVEALDSHLLEVFKRHLIMDNLGIIFLHLCRGLEQMTLEILSHSDSIMANMGSTARALCLAWVQVASKFL